jgi:hypothetical protein
MNLFIPLLDMILISTRVWIVLTGNQEMLWLLYAVIALRNVRWAIMPCPWGYMLLQDSILKKHKKNQAQD